MTSNPLGVSLKWSAITVLVSEVWFDGLEDRVFTALLAQLHKVFQIWIRKARGLN
jgi:hypothetical protein